MGGKLVVEGIEGKTLERGEATCGAVLEFGCNWRSIFTKVFGLFTREEGCELLVDMLVQTLFDCLTRCKNFFKTQLRSIIFDEFCIDSTTAG